MVNLQSRAGVRHFRREFKAANGTQVDGPDEGTGTPNGVLRTVAITRAKKNRFRGDVHLQVRAVKPDHRICDDGANSNRGMCWRQGKRIVFGRQDAGYRSFLDESL
jgi:hypothetical protein